MRHNYQPKPLFIERMKELLGSIDYGRYKKSIEIPERKSIRVNTLKMSVSELKKRLEAKKWKINQPFEDYPEIFIVEGKFSDENAGEEDDVCDKKETKSNNNGKKNSKVINNSLLGGWMGTILLNKNKKIVALQSGELGRSMEHLLGYYYVQEIASMLPAIALNPKPDELVLDLCAAPGSKTTQMAAMMKNKGTIIANDANLDRIKILASNTERCAATNTILTRNDGVNLCRKIAESNKKGEISVRGTLVPLMFDKILVDAPCSGEGTIKSTPKTLLMWNINTIKSLSKLQKKLLESAIEILKVGGEVVYSTCTHAPEENEEVLDYALKKFGKSISMEKIVLPIKCKPGILGWAGGNYDKEVEKSCRVYPHVTNTEGFFISKIKKLK